jgi:hypothetical protein
MFRLTTRKSALEWGLARTRRELGWLCLMGVRRSQCTQGAWRSQVSRRVAACDQVAAMVGAVSRWVPSFSSPSTNWATSARLMESRMVTGRRG